MTPGYFSEVVTFKKTLKNSSFFVYTAAAGTRLHYSGVLYTMSADNTLHVMFYWNPTEPFNYCFKHPFATSIDRAYFRG